MINARNPGRSALHLIFGAILLAACPSRTNSNDELPLDLTVSRDRARAGDSVTITLTNRSDRQAGYNLCPALLDRRIDARWEPHPEPLVEACTMELRILEPVASGTFTHTLPATLPEGTYRFRVSVEWPLGDDNVNVVSPEFEVQR